MIRFIHPIHEGDWRENIRAKFFVYGRSGRIMAKNSARSERFLSEFSIELAVAGAQKRAFVPLRRPLVPLRRPLCQHEDHGHAWCEPGGVNRAARASPQPSSTMPAKAEQTQRQMGAVRSCTPADPIQSAPAAGDCLCVSATAQDVLDHSSIMLEGPGQRRRHASTSSLCPAHGGRRQLQEAREVAAGEAEGSRRLRCATACATSAVCRSE